ncbi:MAG: Xaa-Pro peptidase family protein [Christensenellaceae bacterium]|jgi:Xaa-Pro aminopeptidase|nr:Xaa-Pro peptidase family protein [Christensenellaceae bacterium]
MERTLAQFRGDRAAKIAREQGIDLIITSLPANTEYFSGFSSVGMQILYSAECYLVYQPQDGGMGLVVSAADVPTVMEAGYTGWIYALGAFRFHMPGQDAYTEALRAAIDRRYASAAQALAQAVRDIAPNAGIIAVDEARMPPGTWNALETELAGKCLLSGNHMLHRIKSVKHPEEIALLKNAANVAEDALLALIPSIRAGTSEYDMERLYKQEVTARDANPHFFVATANARGAFSDTWNRPWNKVQEGSAIRFDFGCIYRGFCSDLSRTALLGHNPKAEAYYGAVRAGEERAIAAIKPGVTAGEIFEIAVRETQKAGIPHYWRHHVGHGIGVSTYDLPSIAHNDPTVLEAGMVLCIETPYYEIGWGGVQVEDTVVVTGDGAQYLTNTPRELIKI